SLSPAQAEHVRKVLNDVFDQLEGSSEDERKLLTAQRDKLEAERLKLVQAHYADAIPLDLLKNEQDRIRASLDQITTRLDNLTDTYADARTGLDQLTELLVDLDDLYNKCDPAERRILNRALFTRITIDDEENATYSPDETTASVLAHTSIDAPPHVTAETKLPRHQAGQVSIFSSYVEVRGLEPLTLCLQSRCATNCAIPPCGFSPSHRIGVLGPFGLGGLVPMPPPEEDSESHEREAAQNPSLHDPPRQEVGLPGLEPGIASLSAKRSNRLSYRP